ncbi:hypothetical protein [Salinispora pacifica]|uniref:hypothetical protein n=1 Tax=Salinispora pacifica TaxID=351187 RepID=UPI0004869139
MGTINSNCHLQPATTACDCATGSATDEVVVSGGTVPVCPPPAQVTDQVTVARSANLLPTAPAELLR